MTNLRLLLKNAAHAHDRGAERLQLPPESVDHIQKMTDKMWYGGGRNKIVGNEFYSPIRDSQKNIHGFAAFKRVGSNPYSSRLILTTILSQGMKPKGTNIGHFFDGAVHGKHPELGPKKFQKFDAIPGTK